MIWKKSDSEEAGVPVQAQQPAPPAPSHRSPAQAAKERALIGPSIEIRGDLSGGEDLYVEGRVEGNINLPLHGVTVGKSGRVKADIHGRTIVVMGEIEGNLFGAEQIVLRQSSTVRGNLRAPRVTLEDGSNFKGGIDMSAAPGAEPTAISSFASASQSAASQPPPDGI